MIKSEIDGVYLITHSYGEVIDGIIYDESSAQKLVNKLNERHKKSIKCSRCREGKFKFGEETCSKAEIHFSSSGHGSRCVMFCANDVNDELNKNYIEFPHEYQYQKINVIDVDKMLNEKGVYVNV